MTRPHLIIIITEHCSQFLNHTSILRVHMEQNNQKAVPKQCCPEMIDSLEQLIKKRQDDTKLEKTVKRLKSLIHTQETKVTAAAKALKACVVSRQKGLQRAAVERSSASDLDVMMKHLNKGVMKCVQGRLSAQIVLKKGNKGSCPAATPPGRPALPHWGGIKRKSARPQDEKAQAGHSNKLQRRSKPNEPSCAQSTGLKRAKIHRVQ